MNNIANRNTLNQPSTIRLTIAAVLVAVTLTTAPVSATVLTGTGLHLPETPVGMPMFCAPTITTFIGGFQGTWTSPAQSPWIGTFVATGPVPSSANIGTTVYDFRPMNGLPAGTFLIFGDLDRSSGINERFILDAGGSTGRSISQPWLTTPVGVWGTHGGGGAPTLADMPSWNWDAFNEEYEFDGSSATQRPNPSVGFALQTTVPIFSLRLQKTDDNYAFGLAAPCSVPEPSCLALAAAAMLLPAGLKLRARRARTAPVLRLLS